MEWWSDGEDRLKVQGYSISDFGFLSAVSLADRIADSKGIAHRVKSDNIPSFVICHSTFQMLQYSSSGSDLASVPCPVSTEGVGTDGGFSVQVSGVPLRHKGYGGQAGFRIKKGFGCPRLRFASDGILGRFQCSPLPFRFRQDPRRVSGLIKVSGFMHPIDSV